MKRGLAAAAGLVWINVYLCREFFFRDQLGYMNSMHGFWMALARLGGDAWWHASWWPYWDAGMPFEFTYAPLVPALTSGLSHFGGVPVTRTFYMVSAAVYSIAPLTLFLLAWKWSCKPGVAFIAGALYTLSAPSQLLVPDGAFAWSHFWDARNMYLSFVWDETPHLFALALLPLWLIALDATVRRRRLAAGACAVLCIALMLVASAFGATVVALSLIAYLAAIEPEHRRRALVVSPVLAGLGWLLASPWLPPTLWLTIARNAAASLDTGWSGSSWIELAFVIAGLFLLRRLLRGTDLPLRFLALFAWIVACLPAFGTYLDWHFLPQPNRYKVEMDWALPLLVVFAARPLPRHLPRSLLVVLCLALLVLAYGRVVSHRRYAKALAREGRPLESTIERRVSRWIETNLPGQRVLMSGSISQWANLFSGVPQLGGGSYPTAYNSVQRMASETATWTVEGGLDASLLWMKAFAVRAVVVPGPHSTEFWKSFPVPAAFSRLPVLWNEDDTPIYDIAGKPVSLARVVPAGALVRSAPQRGGDTVELARFVAALEDPSMPAGEFEWLDNNHAWIRGPAEAGQVISLAVNYHRGWRAHCGSRELTVRADGLGLMWINGPCDGGDIGLAYVCR